MPLSDFYPEMKGWTPVEMAEGQRPQIPTPEVQVSPYLRAPLPLPLQYAPDTLKQYNRPGLSSFRINPLPPNGIPAINSTAQSVINSTIINNGQGILLLTNDIINQNQQVLNLAAGNNITLSTDPSGRVQITGQGGSFLAQPQFKNFVVWIPGLVQDGFMNINALFDSVALTSGGIGQGSGFQHLGQTRFFAVRSITFITRVKQNNPGGSLQTWLGLTDDVTGIGFQQTTNTPQSGFIGFRYSQGISSNWVGAVSGGNGNFTIVTGGPTSTSPHTLIAVWDSIANTVTFSSDGVVFGTATTNLPSTIASDMAIISQVSDVGGVGNVATLGNFLNGNRNWRYRTGDATRNVLVDFAYAEQLQLPEALAVNATMPTVSVSDNFNRADGQLGSDWYDLNTPSPSLGTGSNNYPRIVSSVVQPPSPAGLVAYSAWRSTTFPPNQFAQVKIVSLVTANSFILPVVRLKTTGQNRSMYSTVIPGPIGAVTGIIRRWFNNAFVDLSTFSITTAVNDIIRLEVVTNSDNNPVLTVKQNGVVRATFTDTTTALQLFYGQPGIEIHVSSGVVTDAQLDDFSAGSL